MKIRSITCFLNPGWPPEAKRFDAAAHFARLARPAFEAAGYEVQTTRLATPPFPEWLSINQSGDLARQAQELEALSNNAGFEYLSLGPALPEYPHSYAAIPDMLQATQNTFLTGMLTQSEGRISLAAVWACADIIQTISSLSPDGFANLRFAALANVQPGVPFLPSAYHRGEGLTFALATESADLAVDAFATANSLQEARNKLVGSIENHGVCLRRSAEEVAKQSGFSFAGIDFTLAPFPDQTRSIGAALESLGVPAIGLHGTLAAAAFLTDCLDRARYLRTGLNGLMLPILEDAILAQRTAEATVSIKDLLLYSAVCGTGLDTVPLPGDTTPGQLAALLLDIAALAQRLDKPLTGRLMPIPGKKAGELTKFNFGFFANSRILSVNAEPLERLLAGSGTFDLHPRTEYLHQ